MLTGGRKAFETTSYEVWDYGSYIVYRPRSIGVRILVIPPPGVKPQLYGLLYVLMAKSGIEVYTLRETLPCDDVFWHMAKRAYDILKPDLTLSIGVNLGFENELHVGFRDRECAYEHLRKAYIPALDKLVGRPEECISFITERTDKTIHVMSKPIPSVDDYISILLAVDRIARSRKQVLM